MVTNQDEIKKLRDCIRNLDSNGKLLPLKQSKGRWKSHKHFSSKHTKDFDGFINYKLNSAKPKTIRTTLKGMKHFSDYFKDKELTNIEIKDFDEFFANLNGTIAKRTTDRLRGDLIDLHGNYFKQPTKSEHIKKGKETTLKEIDPKDLLTKQEQKKVLENCESVRDKAIIGILFTTGARISELMRCNVGDLEIMDKINENGFPVTVALLSMRITKTGNKVSQKLLVNPLPDLLTYLNEIHPDKDNLEAPLFVSLNHPKKRLKYNGFDRALKKAARKAGISKRIHLHLLRHISATESAREGMSDQEMRLKYNWSKNSKMPSHYSKLQETDLIKKEMEKLGIVSRAEKKKLMKEKAMLKPQLCPRCKTQNSATTRFCKKCWLALDKATFEKINKVEKLTNTLTEDYLLNESKKVSMEDYVHTLVKQLVEKQLKEKIEKISKS